MRKCRFCLKEISDLSRVCEHCGKSLIPGHPPPVTQPATPTARCPHCDEPIATDAVTCSLCNKDVRQPSSGPQLKRCPFCAEDIMAAAIVCKHCHRDLAGGANSAGSALGRREAVNPGVAVILSLFIPGAGQMYAGSVGAGLAWLFFTVIGYAIFVIPGLILHLCAIVGAHGTAQRRNARGV